jgi:hypothetical protein
MKKKKERHVKIDRVKSLAGHLAKNYRKMKNFYSQGKIAALVNFLKKRDAVLITPDYKRIRGGASAKIWKEARANKAKLEFRPVSTFFGSALGKKPISDNKQLDSVAFVVHEVHFIEKTGPARRNATSYMITADKHIDDCHWFED